MRKRFFATAAIAALAALAACATESVDSSASALTDAFRNPTQHGKLVFDETQRASFSSDERFHAWTFAVTGQVDVSLETTDLDTNVDTVMYLYATDGDGRVSGSYIAKNDDHQGLLASKLSKGLAAGSYLVLVKAHKPQITGDFGVLGSCFGAGCPLKARPRSLEQLCDIVEADVATCVSEPSTVEQCAPKGDSLALQCCNSQAESYCDVTCAAGSAPLDGDLNIAYEYIGDYAMSLDDITGQVIPTCSGVTFADVIENAKNSPSDLLSEHRIQGGWGEGAIYERTGIDSGILWESGALLEEFDALAHDDHLRAWNATADVDCQNCDKWIEKWVLFYPNTGVVIELEGTFSWD